MTTKHITPENVLSRALALAFAALAFAGGSTCSAAPDNQAPAPTPPPWARHYYPGEKIVYRMRATNRDPNGTTVYEFKAKGAAKKDPAGGYTEEFGWSNVTSFRSPTKIDLFSLSGPSAWEELVANQPKLTLSSASLNYRQRLALPPIPQPNDFMKIASSMAGIGRLDPSMIGPVADLTTIYVDLLLSASLGGGAKSGDHRYVDSAGRANSWADGNRVMVGEDSVDFDCSVKTLDANAGIVTLRIDHVPPAHPGIKVPANWMSAPVAGTPNNWVEVRKNQNGTCTAAVGKETFEVLIQLSLADGHILSVHLDNPVEYISRECPDSTLNNPGPVQRRQLRRQIEITSLPE